MDVREINSAIVAHAKWKTHLLEAITSGTSSYKPGIVLLDNECEFGKWLHAIPASNRPEEFWPKTQKVHARFHEEAARILEFALNGRPDEALALMTDIKGLFVSTSAELTNTLFAWKKASS